MRVTFTMTISLVALLSIAVAPDARAEKERPSLQGLSIVVPVATGNAKWGAAEITKRVRIELARAVGVGMMSPDSLVEAQAQILASQSAGELDALELNTAAYLSRAGRISGARYIVRLSVVKKRQGFEPVAAIIDVNSSEVVEAVRVGKYRRVQSSRDKGKELGRAVVKALRTIRSQNRSNGVSRQEDEAELEGKLASRR